MITENDLDINTLHEYRLMFPDADNVRFSIAGGKIFMILGYDRNTKEDAGQWVDQDGVKQDFDYLYEMCVASGDNLEELMESAREYKRHADMKWSQFFKEHGASDEFVNELIDKGL
jgi:hypothetical protein